MNCRKQSSPSLDALLPESDYRLFAVCARYPQNLEQRVRLTCVREGVFEVDALGRSLRIIVAGQLPRAAHNALLHLFSAREELVRYGREHYRLHSKDTSSLLYQLFKAYEEGRVMSDKLKEFVRQTIDELLAELPAEERLNGLAAEERLKGLSADQVARALSPETLAELAQKLKTNGSPPKPP